MDKEQFPSTFKDGTMPLGKLQKIWATNPLASLLRYFHTVFNTVESEVKRTSSLKHVTLVQEGPRPI